MIKKVDKNIAKEIASWQYDVPYDIYNMKDAYDEMLASYYAVVEEEVIGYFCMRQDAQVPPGTYPDTHLDFGIGLKPDKCGKGHGKHFMNVIIKELRKYDKPLRLTVLENNKRAIRLYKSLGFEEVERFYRGVRLFIVMIEKS